MSVCNNTNVTVAGCHVDPLQGLAYSAVFLLGFLVNAAALCAFTAQRDSLSATHIYMLNLAIADTTLLLFLPFRIYDAFFCLPNNHLCTFLLSLHFINMYASILTTTAIGVHRYLVIRFPLQARSWRKKKETAFAACLLIWVFLVTTCVVFREDNYPRKLWTCFERCKNIPLRPQFMAILVFLGYVAPLSVVVFCSSCIVRILIKTDNKSGEKKRTIGIVTANMIVFVVCYTPIHYGSRQTDGHYTTEHDGKGPGSGHI
ncbi:G-protein coupled receptor 35-like [Clinocottus analis]|uniref:G-protein coupled receptor 35-like n=1 Tax=Clinocottus analis TaxID=304258 RepID=UPI0035C0EB51